MTDVEIIPEGIVELLNSTEALAVLDEAADRIAQAAIRNTRRGTDERGGHMQDAYYLYPAQPGPQGGEAAAANSSPVFHLEEFGSVNQAPQAPFRRAVLDAGYELEEIAK